MQADELRLVAGAIPNPTAEAGAKDCLYARAERHVSSAHLVQASLASESFQGTAHIVAASHVEDRIMRRSHRQVARWLRAVKFSRPRLLLGRV
jgi:hypothetical protein